MTDAAAKPARRPFATFALAAFLALGALGGCAKDLPAAIAEARHANAASQFLPLSDGVRLHMRDEGPRDAPAIVLLHGSNASLHTWEPWVAALKGRWRVVSLDFPAHGLTGPSASGVYDGAAYVRVVEETAAALKLDRFTVAGNSMGGYVAWRYALAHPERVAGLVIVNGAGYPREGGSPWVFQLARAPVLGELFSRLATREMLARNLREVIVDDALVTDAMTRRYHDLLLREGNREATLARLRAPRDAPEAWRDIPKIKAPTLVIWGREDPWIPVADAERFARDIPGARLLVIDRVGHIPQEEAPGPTAAAVDAFLDEVRAVEAARAGAPVAP
jgi:pimeloyl-ACP methyl ester carboxylesterase